MNRFDFLPVSKEDVLARGWSEVDFVYVTGDAYVDHPKASSFGGGGPRLGVPRSELAELWGFAVSGGRSSASQ